jgi:hypothetical protein
MALAISRKNDGYYLLSGCDVHEKTPNDMYVVVDSGLIVYDNVVYTITGNNVLLASDATFPRFYTIYLTTTTATGHQGTAAAISPIGETNFRKMESPHPPDSTPTGVILAVVYVPAGATSIADATILDIGQHGTRWAVQETPSGTMDGANQTFTLAHTPITTVELYWGSGLGLAYMTYGIDYTVSGTTITLVTFAPNSVDGDYLRARYQYRV